MCSCSSFLVLVLDVLVVLADHVVVVVLFVMVVCAHLAVVILFVVIFLFYFLISFVFSCRFPLKLIMVPLERPHYLRSNDAQCRDRKSRLRLGTCRSEQVFITCGFHQCDIFVLNGVMWQRQCCCERYNKIMHEEWLIIFAPRIRFSNFENRWKADDETFATLFEI